jgi:hypothetical protein
MGGIMRIQILELPSKQVGEYYETPFAVVIDRCDSEVIRSWGGETEIVSKRSPGALKADDIKDALGAQAVLVFSEDVEIG